MEQKLKQESAIHIKGGRGGRARRGEAGYRGAGGAESGGKGTGQQFQILEPLSAQQQYLSQNWMSSPYGYFGRYATFPYQYASQFWPMGGSPSFAVALGQPYSQLPQQQNFSYPLQRANYPPQLSSPAFSPLITRTHFAPAAVPTDGRPRQWPQSQGNKIQKTDELKKSALVIEISDEEEEAQVEKSPPFKIPDVARTVESTSTTTQKRSQNDLTPKSQERLPPPRKDSKPKEKPLSKPEKTKKIEKKVKITEEPPKKPAAVRPVKVEQPRRTFLSQRISSKVQAKRNLYRLSRKEKNVLEVTLLRNHVNEILTGPQFQAKIPDFVSASKDFAAHKNRIRESLLARLYQEEEEE